MDSLDFTRSKALNNIPNKKLLEMLSVIENSDEDIKAKSIKGIALNRYAESNIPIEYWSLKMERDFKGDPKLLDKYKEYTADIKSAYINGTSICFAGSHGVGKRISLETELPTPNGFVKLKDLKEGDQLFDEQGNICNITKLHPIDLSSESYRITFDDDTIVDACADHLWLTHTRDSRKNRQYPSIKSTKLILQTLRVGGKQNIANHSIQCSRPINYPKKDLLIDPYVLGCWLGDGSSNDGSIECADIEILNEIEKSGYPIHLYKSSIATLSKSCHYRIGDLININGGKIGYLTNQLKKLNLLKNKHIPEQYLYSSYEQRLSLLQGLLDTDGSCNKGGLIEFTSVISLLANQTYQLIKSLGIKAKLKINKSFCYKKQCKDRYRITFSTKLPLFRLKRKLNRIRLIKTQLSRTEHRFIVDIKRIDPVAMRCITVDSPSHLFLITRSFIATHNTMTVSCILKKSCQKGYSCLYSTLGDIVHVVTQALGEDKYLARRELALVDFLVIDEFDSRFMPSENAADLYARSLESVFRTRSQNKLPTLMCTNSPNIVESFNGPLKQSIDSLIKGYLNIYPVFGEDFRKKRTS
jgi:DNA replication protein DnaC